MRIKDISTIQRFLGVVEGAVCAVDFNGSDYIINLVGEISDILDREMEHICKERESNE